MKITDIKSYLVHAVRRNWVFLEIETDEGVVGVGEATLEGFAKSMVTVLEDFKRLLVGQDPGPIEKIYEELIRKKFWRLDTVIMTAISGIEMALWDIKGKVLNTPVYSLLGGPCRDRVKAYGNYWFMGAKTVDDYARMAAVAVDKGFTALKWSPYGKPAHNATPDEEKVIVECVRRVREAVGPDIDLMLDAHGRFNLPTAIRIARKLEEFNPFFLEEMLPPENVDAFVQLRRSTRCPLATGERLLTRFQFRELLAKFAVDYIQPDTVHCGGIAETRKIAALAETYYTPVIPHNPCGPVATAAMIHVAASIPNFLVLEYIPVPERSEAVLVEPLELKESHFSLPTKPGLGVELNKKVFDKWPYQEKDLDHYSDVRVIRM